MHDSWRIKSSVATQFLWPNSRSCSRLRFIFRVSRIRPWPSSRSKVLTKWKVQSIKMFFFSLPEGGWVGWRKEGQHPGIAVLVTQYFVGRWGKMGSLRHAQSCTAQPGKMALHMYNSVCKFSVFLLLLAHDCLLAWEVKNLIGKANWIFFVCLFVLIALTCVAETLFQFSKTIPLPIQ